MFGVAIGYYPLKWTPVIKKRDTKVQPSGYRYVLASRTLQWSCVCVRGLHVRSCINEWYIVPKHPINVYMLFWLAIFINSSKHTYETSLKIYFTRYELNLGENISLLPCIGEWVFLKFVFFQTRFWIDAAFLIHVHNTSGCFVVEKDHNTGVSGCGRRRADRLIVWYIDLIVRSVLRHRSKRSNRQPSWKCAIEIC